MNKLCVLPPVEDYNNIEYAQCSSFDLHSIIENEHIYLHNLKMDSRLSQVAYDKINGTEHDILILGHRSLTDSKYIRGHLDLYDANGIDLSQFKNGGFEILCCNECFEISLRKKTKARVEKAMKIYKGRNGTSFSYCWIELELDENKLADKLELYGFQKLKYDPNVLYKKFSSDEYDALNCICDQSIVSQLSELNAPNLMPVEFNSL